MAIREHNQWRTRLWYVLTSNAPSPVSCLARSNHISTCQRANAARSISSNEVFCGALLTKYLASFVLGFRATISQYRRSVGRDGSVEELTRWTRAALTSQRIAPRVVSLMYTRFHSCSRKTGLKRHTLSTRLDAWAAWR